MVEAVKFKTFYIMLQGNFGLVSKILAGLDSYKGQTQRNN